MSVDNLIARYQQLQSQIDVLSDFPEERIQRSRSLFEFKDDQIIPKRFDVWTCLAGLPLPSDLTQNLQQVVAELRALLPEGTPFYAVKPTHYHWELLIIKRPAEALTLDQLNSVTQLLKITLQNQPAFTIDYRGLSITPDGVLLAKGYGNFDQLRAYLKQSIPIASPQQSQLGHISLGRILQPIGADAFGQLKPWIQDRATVPYGHFTVQTIKYIHEQQWYMEDYDVVAQYDLTAETL